MRKIRKIDVVTSQGAKTYILGDVVNGLTITDIVECSVEYESALHIGYRMLSNGSGSTIRNLVVEIWGAPVVVEYYETEVTGNVSTIQAC